MNKKVFVSGCYDMLHSGHVAFFEEAARHGDLYVGLGSDKTIHDLKGRKTINTERERLYMVKSIRHVKDAFINSGSGIMDFIENVKQLRPDIFFVNKDGYTPEKERFCKENGIELIVSTRTPAPGLPRRSTTELRRECNIPYRIDLAGGWMDQPYVNKFHPGAVLTISIEPDYDFNDRSGMSTSSRKVAMDMWQVDIPDGDRERLAKILFCFENPPGTDTVSGSQDALGIVMPGLNRLEYDNNYWPHRIESVTDEPILDFIESNLWLIPLSPRNNDYKVLADTHINDSNVRRLSAAADACWEALLKKDVKAWGAAVTESFHAQISMFPKMVTDSIMDSINKYIGSVKGIKLSGAGGGGYLIIVNDKPVEDAIQIRIRRN